MKKIKKISEKNTKKKLDRQDLEDEGFSSIESVQEEPGDEKCFVLKVTKEPQGRAQSIIWGSVLTDFSYFSLQAK